MSVIRNFRCSTQCHSDKQYDMIKIRLPAHPWASSSPWQWFLLSHWHLVVTKTGWWFDTNIWYGIHHLRFKGRNWKMAHIEDVDQQNCGYSPINLGDDPQSLKRHDRRKNRVRLSFFRSVDNQNSAKHDGLNGRFIKLNILHTCFPYFQF